MAESRHSQSDLYIWDGIEGTSSASDLPTMDNSPGRRWGPDMSAVPSINNSNTQVPISQPSNIWTPRPNSITNKDTSLSPMDGLIRSAATVAKDSQAEGNGYYRIKPSGPMGRPISVPSPNMYPQNITSVSRHDNLIHPHNINSTSSSQGLLNSGPSPLVVPQPVAVKVPRPNKTYHCRMCDQEFTSKSDMQRHAKDIHKMEEKAHKCPTCFKSFPTTQQLTQHLLVHNNIRKYKCSYCDKAFKQLSHLQQHHRRHTGERPYKCSMEGCGKAFAQLSNLQQHQRNHDNRKNDPERKPYLCHICDRRFATDASLNNHISKLHVGIMVEMDRKCQQCGKQFFDDERYLKHVHKHHPDYWLVLSGGKPLEFFLTPHEVKHREKRFNCTYCDKRFSHETGLLKHLATHPQREDLLLKLWSCTVCKKVFTKESYLERHMEMKSDPEHTKAWDEISRKCGFRQMIHPLPSAAQGAPLHGGIGGEASTSIGKGMPPGPSGSLQGLNLVMGNGHESGPSHPHPSHNLSHHPMQNGHHNPSNNNMGQGTGDNFSPPPPQVQTAASAAQVSRASSSASSPISVTSVSPGGPSQPSPTVGKTVGDLPSPEPGYRRHDFSLPRQLSNREFSSDHRAIGGNGHPHFERSHSFDLGTGSFSLRRGLQSPSGHVNRGIQGLTSTPGMVSPPPPLNSSTANHHQTKALNSGCHSPLQTHHHPPNMIFPAHSQMHSPPLAHSLPQPFIPQNLIFGEAPVTSNISHPPAPSQASSQVSFQSPANPDPHPHLVSTHTGPSISLPDRSLALPIGSSANSISSSSSTSSSQNTSTTPALAPITSTSSSSPSSRPRSVPPALLSIPGQYRQDHILSNPAEQEEIVSALQTLAESIP